MYHKNCQFDDDTKNEEEAIFVAPSFSFLFLFPAVEFNEPSLLYLTCTPNKSNFQFNHSSICAFQLNKKLKIQIIIIS